ncbi:hypothetical protein AB0F91_39725 [Amycolatopsis sp. NPDC023774]|uniref:hypothetical protein n=1 Tax=Amycolatopsis sp. NPDC023774 TaxID=3155015 RepID=UPI00340E5FEB
MDQGRVVTPELDRWGRHADRDDRRTAVVRVCVGTDLERVASRLAAIGMAVASSGSGSVIGQVSPGVLRRIGQESGVLAVEKPQGLRQLADR